MSPSDITIAVTVYDRRTYVKQAVASALGQDTSEPPQVMVVEDCGPDDSLRDFILSDFGSRIRYSRNSKRRGLFDNWNACIEQCETAWLCILHDDDILEPTFARSMIELAQAAPNRGLYYGRWNVIDEKGTIIEKAEATSGFAWSEPNLADWAQYNRVSFAAHLFNVAAARRLGGFRATSRYTGDWEMWFRLAVHDRAAGTNRVVGNFREHHSIGRGTTAVNLNGRKYAYGNVQRKRNFALLRNSKNSAARFDRGSHQGEMPMSTRWLLSYAAGFTPRIARYNTALLAKSAAPHPGYAVFRDFVRVTGWRGLKMLSRVYRLTNS